MRFHDWINNIRWKYFTNNKSGLIFKELTKEFQMGNKMTENKRYNIKPSKIIEDGFCIQDDEREHSFPTVDDKSNLIMYEKALNEQDKEIKELDKYCTACDDTLLTIQELTYKLLTIDFKDIEMSFICDCIKSINKCDLLEMKKSMKVIDDYHKHDDGDVE